MFVFFVCIFVILFATVLSTHTASPLEGASKPLQKVKAELAIPKTKIPQKTRTKRKKYKVSWNRKKKDPAPDGRFVEHKRKTTSEVTESRLGGKGAGVGGRVGKGTKGREKLVR